MSNVYKLGMCFQQDSECINLSYHLTHPYLSLIEVLMTDESLTETTGFKACYYPVFKSHLIQAPTASPLN